MLKVDKIMHSRTNYLLMFVSEWLSIWTTMVTNFSRSHPSRTMTKILSLNRIQTSVQHYRLSPLSRFFDDQHLYGMISREFWFRNTRTVGIERCKRNRDTLEVPLQQQSLDGAVRAVRKESWSLREWDIVDFTRLCYF